MKTKEENATLFAVGVLLRQIEEESLQSFMWLLSTVNRCLIVDENMSLIEFKNLIKQNCPERFADFKRIMEPKELPVID